MIIQNASADGRTDLTFTIPRTDLRRALELVRSVAGEISAAGVRHEERVAKVSIIGVGMRTHAGVAATMFKVLAAEGVNIEMIATSEIESRSWLIRSTASLRCAHCTTHSWRTE
jgi:aspartate kinase